MFCRGSGNLGFDRCLLYFAHEKEEQIENGGTTADAAWKEGSVNIFVNELYKLEVAQRERQQRHQHFHHQK